MDITVRDLTAEPESIILGITTVELSFEVKLGQTNDHKVKFVLTLITQSAPVFIIDLEGAQVTSYGWEQEIDSDFQAYSIPVDFEVTKSQPKEKALRIELKATDSDNMSSTTFGTIFYQ